jgi:hypothetical protein
MDLERNSHHRQVQREVGRRHCHEAGGDAELGDEYPRSPAPDDAADRPERVGVDERRDDEPQAVGDARPRHQPDLDQTDMRLAQPNRER